MKKIGIYGGTFDPIHLGHLIIAQSFLEQFSLDQCYFIPAKVSPFKTETHSYFSDKERVKMIEMSIDNNPKFEIDTFEINHPEISYTINTIHHFKDSYPSSELFLLIGFDQAINFEKWKENNKIRELAQVVVAQRHNLFGTGHKLSEIKKKFILLNNPIISISSTMLREKINEKKSIRYMVADAVWNFIEKEKYGR